MSTYFMTKIKSVWLKSKLNENKSIDKKKGISHPRRLLKKTKKMKEIKLYYEVIIIVCIF